MLKLLKKWFTENIGYKIISIVLAVFIWIVIVNIIDPDTTRTISDIPVVIQNEEAVLDGSHLYTITSGDTVSITISGARSIVNSLSASDFTATADFSEVSITGAVPISVSLTPGNIKYSSRIEISLNTASMRIEVDEISEVTRMIEIDFTGKLKDGLIIDDFSLDPESVVITSPQSISGSIARVSASVDYSDISSTGYVYGTLVIYDGNGNEIKGDNISIDSETVAVYIEVSHVKQIPINYTVGGDPAEGYEVSEITASTEYVNIKGEESALSKIESIEIGAEALDVTDRKSSLSTTVDITAYLPDDVALYGESSTVTVRVVITNTK